jgi:hypothetical protein
VRFGRCDGPVDHVTVDHRTRTVVDQDHVRRFGGECFQAEPHGLLAGRPSVNGRGQAEVTDGRFIGAGIVRMNHAADPGDARMSKEGEDCPPNDRRTGEVGILLGQCAAETGAASGGDDESDAALHGILVTERREPTLAKAAAPELHDVCSA